MELIGSLNHLNTLTNFDFSVYEPGFLTKTAESRMQQLNHATLEDYVSFLASNENEVEILVNSFNIHVSSFFRDPFTFALLENVIIPKIINNKHHTKQKEIRIWSAGCAAGQEAYSLAILLQERIQYEVPEINYRIFATDLTDEVLRQATTGYFREYDVAHVSHARLNQYFKYHSDHYWINEVLKRHVSFSKFNLLNEKLKCPSESLFGDFDIIFCSNVLIYYTPKIRKEILHRLKNCLSLNGYIIVDRSENEIMLINNFQSAFPQSSIFT